VPISKWKNYILICLENKDWITSELTIAVNNIEDISILENVLSSLVKSNKRNLFIKKFEKITKKPILTNLKNIDII
jgi:DNA-binding HxlR family transcriptional regulator